MEALWFEEQGTGPAVLLVHGLGGTARAHFGTLIGALAHQYRLILPDLRGHGGSRGLATRCDASYYDQLADDLLGLVDQLALARVHLVGYSDGGEAALLLAARLGVRATSCTVWATSGAPPPPEIVALYDDPAARLPGWPAFRDELERLHGSHGPALLPCWAAAMRALSVAGGPATPAPPPQPACPTLIIAGEHDPFNPLTQVRALAASLPGSALVVLGGAGHDLLAEREPQLLALIRRSLATDVEQT